jgi:hypothetical protein
MRSETFVRQSAADASRVAVETGGTCTIEWDRGMAVVGLDSEGRRVGRRDTSVRGGSGELEFSTRAGHFDEDDGA